MKLFCGSPSKHCLLYDSLNFGKTKVEQFICASVSLQTLQRMTSNFILRLRSVITEKTAAISKSLSCDFTSFQDAHFDIYLKDTVLWLQRLLMSSLGTIFVNRNITNSRPIPSIYYLSHLSVSHSFADMSFQIYIIISKMLCMSQ